MRFQTKGHRNGEVMLNQPQFAKEWGEFQSVITRISDEAITKKFIEKYEGKRKSISSAINDLIREGLLAVPAPKGKGWRKEAPIFQDRAFEERRQKRWKLDFAKGELCVEVAFNHGEATAWNLFKPVLSSELNHVTKAIQTRAGIVVLATNALRDAGGFDRTIMTYERIDSYLRAFNNLINVPMLIVGLEPPTSFKIEHDKVGRKKIGRIVPLP